MRAAIERRMDRYTAALDGTASLFHASRRLTDEEFRAYIDRLDIERRYPGIYSIGYIRHVREAIAGGDEFALVVTETAIILDPMRASRTLDRVHALGLRVSIDDFGTGYSSLAYLRRLPIDTLKVDRTFVRDIAQDANDAAIVRSTIHLAHDMGLEVVAEGIESAEVLALLRQMGCDQGQDFLIARPQPAEIVGPWIRRRDYMTCD